MTEVLGAQPETVVAEVTHPGLFCWFIIHTYSGYENKVKASLAQRILMEGRADRFGAIEIPEETYEEMKSQEIAKLVHDYNGTVN